MKRRFAAAALAAMTLMTSLALAGCSSDEQNQAGEGQSADLLEQIRDRGELIIATEGTWAPWTYHDEEDDLVGFDVEVAQRVAEKLGVKATFVEGEFDGLLAGLETGRYDMIANGVEITEERSEKYDFSTPLCLYPHRSDHPRR